MHEGQRRRKGEAAGCQGKSYDGSPVLFLVALAWFYNC